jgi:outer membrane lipopolysaccharide assembly protein LptE/RlpB
VSRSPSLKALALLGALLTLAGCGYHIAGHGGALPAGTQTVAVLPFSNHTAQPRLSQMVSAAEAREFELRTHLHVQATADGSDAAVHGNVVSVTATPVTFDTTSGHATTVEVVVHLQAWVTATATGKEVFRNDDMVFHEQYQISTQEQNFIEEDTSAFQRLSQTVAQTLVSDVLEAF